MYYVVRRDILIKCKGGDVVEPHVMKTVHKCRTQFDDSHLDSEIVFDV